jgi:hypothetical protein
MKLKDQQQPITDIEMRESKCSDLERGFVDSISKQMEKGYTLSEKQIATLEKIWEKVT